MTSETFTMEDFIEKFHTISGTTIGERRKNLFQLLQSTNNVNIDFSKLQPKNQLEESFKIEVMIYHKNAPGLIEVFKTENPALIKKVIKINWLWNFFDEHVIRELFPKISFNSKLKVINKLASHLKDTQKADAIFTFLNEKYGMYLAGKLLPCCSFALISQYFTLNVIKHLHVRRILFIIQKHSELTEVLLQNKTNGILENKAIFRKVSQNHFSLFDKFYPTISYGYSLKLGRRATVKFVQANKPEIINKADYFYMYLHKKQLVKSIGADFPQFYSKMFPKDYNELRSKITLCLELLDSRNIQNKFDVFASTYASVYGGDFLESNLIDLSIFELMNDAQRLRVAEHLDIPNMVWICLSKTEKSLPIIKKLISLSSDTKKRAQLVGSLVDTCRINNDYTALADVCGYVYKHHRNDDSSVLLCFLQALGDSKVVTKLYQEHFFYIGKILKIVVNRDTMYYQYSNCLYAYFYFLYVENKSFKQHVQLYASKLYDIANVGYGFKFSKSQELEKQYLITLGEVLPDIYKDKELKSQYVHYLNTVMRWNKKHRNDLLPLFVNEDVRMALLDQWENEDNNYMSASVISHILCLKDIHDKSFWVETYFKKKSYTEMNVMEWLIKYEPTIVHKHISTIMDFILDMYYTQFHRFFFTMARNYTHLELPQKVTKICVDVISSIDESDSRKKNALTALSYVAAEPQEFITLLTPYYPIDKTEPDPTVYVMQQNMSRSLGNTVPSSSMLKSVLLFSKGDYTKFIRRSMYLVAFSVTEDKLGEFFTELNNLAVSVRKHAIYLGFRVLDRNSIYNIVKRNSSDENVSIRKFLMRSIFNFFIRNPDDFVWNMLKESIKNVDMEDKEALDVLVQFEKVPIKYMKQYIEFVAAFIVFDDKVASLVPDSTYAVLETDFVMNIINSNKCKDVFIYKCLINSNNNMFQFTIIQTVFNQQKESKFLKECATYFISNKYSKVALFDKCIELLNTLQPPEKYFGDAAYAHVCKIYAEFYMDKKSASKFANALIHAAEAFITKYKAVAFDEFCEVVDDFITPLFAEEDVYTLIHNLMENSSSVHSITMAIGLLPSMLPSAPRSKSSFNKIVEMLKLNPHPVTNMALSVYLNEIMPRHAVVEEQTKCESRYNSNYFFYNTHIDTAYARCVFSFS